MFFQTMGLQDIINNMAERNENKHLLYFLSLFTSYTLKIDQIFKGSHDTSCLLVR